VEDKDEGVEGGGGGGLHGENDRTPPRTKTVRVLKGIIRGKWKVEGGKGQAGEFVWPPQTYPRLSGAPAPRFDGFPLTRGDSRLGLRLRKVRGREREREGRILV
jgi:hypothetical protein